MMIRRTVMKFLAAAGFAVVIPLEGTREAEALTAQDPRDLSEWRESKNLGLKRMRIIGRSTAWSSNHLYTINLWRQVGDLCKYTLIERFQLSSSGVVEYYARPGAMLLFVNGTLPHIEIDTDLFDYWMEFHDFTTTYTEVIGCVGGEPFDYIMDFGDAVREPDQASDPRAGFFDNEDEG